MGSFNVACSVSSLSINSGDEVLFFPLLPTHFSSSRPHEVGVHSTLIYSDCYFTPFCLPIRGKYNDYGSVEDVVHDANTRAIEEFFGITIDQFIGSITGRQGFTDTYSDLFETYSLHQNLLRSYETKFDDSFMLAIGFVKKENGRYQFEDHKLEIDVRASNGQYARGNHDAHFYEVDGTLLYGAGPDHCFSVKEFLERYHKISGYMLNIPKDKQTIVKLLGSISCMFVHGDIYKSLSDYTNRSDGSVLSMYVNDTFLRDHGFIDITRDVEGLFAEDKNDRIKSTWHNPAYPYHIRVGDYGSSISYLLKDDTHKYEKEQSVYSIKQFTSDWTKLTGEHFDVAALAAASKYDIYYDGFHNVIKSHYEELKRLKDLLNHPLYAHDDTVKHELAMLNFKDPFSRFGNDNRDFLGLFEKWEFFKDLYRKPIANGELKREFSDYRAFYWAMYSCNRFFFPAMNGEQSGNNKASKALYEASLSVINERIADEEYDGEYEDE
jgi:hypothetical protein